MAFIGFDLDETLGSFGPLHNHVLFLIPSAVYETLLPGQEPFAPSESLRRKLHTAMKEFAKCLVENDSELGILRKGIVPIMRRLAEAKGNGYIRAMSIYSNNGNLGLLLLASAMIEAATGYSDLFCNHINWYNPLRSAEINPQMPGSGMKTAAVLRKSFIGSHCGSLGVANVPLARLYFFDDVDHAYLRAVIGDEHYFKVKPYRNEVADLRPVDECLDSAFKVSGLATDDEYLRYIKPMLIALESPTNTYEDILSTIKRVNSAYAPRKVAFIDDTDAILERIDSIFPITNYGENYFPVVDGGRRRARRRRSRTYSKVKRVTKKSTRKN